MWANNLTNLKEGPIQVAGDFSCCSNDHLTSLEGAPKEIRGNFDCSHNHLRNFKGGPSHIGGSTKHDNNPMDQLMEIDSADDDIEQIINGF